MMKKFWELFEQSIITQAVVTLILIATVSTLYIMGKPVPEDLLQITFTVVGFWFGSKVGYSQSSAKAQSLKGSV
jgi:hypothetical protein